MQKTILSIQNLSKTYPSGLQALKNISLDIQEGELFALLGPNGAGKTTLIGCTTGYVKKTSGTILLNGYDTEKNVRKSRQEISLVPQELTLDIFYTVEDTLKFQRGLYGKKHDPELLERILSMLSLTDKRNTEVRQLSGGMKRRVLIAKALMNTPKVLFLDEPTAGVDVELRHGMWEAINSLKKEGMTVILTTHYLEEAENMADRIGIINNGSLIALDETASLLSRFGEKRIDLHMDRELQAIPQALAHYDFELTNSGMTLRYFASRNDISPHAVLADLRTYGINICDIDTKTSSLEEIFIQLIDESKNL